MCYCKTFAPPSDAGTGLPSDCSSGLPLFLLYHNYPLPSTIFSGLDLYYEEQLLLLVLPLKAQTLPIPLEKPSGLDLCAVARLTTPLTLSVDNTITTETQSLLFHFQPQSLIYVFTQL